MKGFRLAALGILLGVGQIAAAAGSTGMVITHFEPLSRMEWSGSRADGAQKFAVRGPATLQFDALGRSYTLQLESNDALLSPRAHASRRTPVSLYKGRIDGIDGSWVRITFYDGHPRGLLFDGTELYAIEAPGDSGIATDGPVMYRLADSYVLPGTMACDAGAPFGNGAQVFEKLAGGNGYSAARAPGASVQLNLGAIGDYEFTNQMGSGAEAAILTRLNNVDGIFSDQLGVQLSVEELEVFNDPADPFSDTTAPIDLLDELGNYRQLTPNQALQGLTHLYTGKDLDGSTVGIAYTGALCSTRFGAGLSEGTNGSTTDTLVAAHEIGHNFGAPHDGETGSACEAEPQTFLMAPMVNGSDTFSQCSITEMSDDVQSAPCIFPLPSTDMTIELSGQAPQPLLGGSATMNFDATNLGSETATNVEVDITIPSNFTFVSASSTAGTCTNGAGNVNCPLGDVTGGTSRTVTLSTIANDTQTGTFVATVSADVDDDPSNNQETVQVTALPAVDMAATAPSSTVTVNQASSLRATIENLSSMSATNVRATINLNDGLSVTAATWSAGSCSITGQQIDCTAASFAAQSSSTLDIDFSGTSLGQKGYTLTLSSDDTDSNTNNNSATGNVTVNDASGGGGGGGGGSEESGGGSMSLLVLALLAGLRARRQKPAP